MISAYRQNSGRQQAKIGAVPPGQTRIAFERRRLGVGSVYTQRKSSSIVRHFHCLSHVARSVEAVSRLTSNMSSLSWAEIAGCVVVLYSLRKFLNFLLANCDMTLFSKRDVPSKGYTGKVVWIVGASQGLGEALANHWATCGASIILSARSKDKLENVRSNCLRYTDNVAVLPIDVTWSFEMIKKTAEKAFAEFGGVDYIVYNAGASQHAAVEMTSVEVSKKLVDMNLMGQVAVATASMPLMVQQGRGGHHIVIASMAACVPSPGQAMYSATKSAVKAYFLSLASELAARWV